MKPRVGNSVPVNDTFSFLSFFFFFFGHRSVGLYSSRAFLLLLKLSQKLPVLFVSKDTFAAA